MRGFSFPMSKDPHKPLFILVAGTAGSGKDAITTLLAERLKAATDSFAAPVYRAMVNAVTECLVAAGMDEGEARQKADALVRNSPREFKDKHVRPGLVSIGSGCTRSILDSAFVDIIIRKAKAADKPFIVSDLRFYETELQACRQRMSDTHRVFCVYVERPGVGPVNEDEARELPLIRKQADIIVDNSGDLTTLPRLADDTCTCIVNMIRYSSTADARATIHPYGYYRGDAKQPIP